MNVSSEHSQSFWMHDTALQDEPALVKSAEADVVIVGAGIAGLSVAYELTRAGKTVVVLDRGPIAGGMTARTTAHLASELDDYYHELIKVRGLQEARDVYAAQAAAIDRIESIVREEAIDCDFRRLDGYLFLDPSTSHAVLDKEFEAAKEVGLEVTWADPAPLPGQSAPALRFPNQARFHPLKYIEGLVRCIKARGGRLHANTIVTQIAQRDDGRVLIATEGGAEVRASACAVATNSPVNELKIHFKQAPYRTYAIAGRVPAGAVPDALYWDTLNPYHYVRLQEAEDGWFWLISGGEDHKSGEASDMEERFDRLESWTRAKFPTFGSVVHRWSGQVLEPVDHAAFIGRSPTGQNIYMATGDSGQGMTNGVAASLIISGYIVGQEPGFSKAHDPERATGNALKEFVAENLTATTNLTEYVTPGDISSSDELKPGEGAIVRRGLSKVAAYRDDSGELHLCSAVCTHAGCIVHWNPFEKCWDCPCHGSHFAIDGTAINGPAVSPLARVDP
jgi:glycine/D-amino acid oxidase-like deaminating enzyme/nitrite reductase/ring-hydroxylating ferredoxin subunit